MKKRLRIQPPPYLNVANLVSLFRLLLLPAFFYCLFCYIAWGEEDESKLLLSRTYYFISLALVPLILLTDYLDGWLARKLDLENPLGAFLDPLADKFFAFFAIALLTWGQQVPLWLAVIVFFKDFFILIGWVLLFILGYDTEISPSRLGKASAVCQGVVVLTAILSLPGGESLVLPGFPLYTLAVNINQPWFHITTAILTILAGASYILEGLRRAQRVEPDESGKIEVLPVAEGDLRSKDN